MQVLVLSGTALIAATYGLARFGYGLFLPQFTQAFAMSSAAAGAVSAGSFVSYCLALALASRIGAHPRRMILCAGGSAALGSLGVAASPSFVVFALSMVTAGAGAGFASPGLVALVERNVSVPRRETAQTVVNSGTGGGIVAAGALLLLTVDHWRVGWLVVAVTVLAATVAVLRADNPTPRRQQDSPPAQPPAHGPARTGALAPFSRPVVAAALAGISSAAIWTFGASVMTGAESTGDAYATLAWMVLGAFGVLGAAAAKMVQIWDVRIAWATTCLTMATATILLGSAPGSFVVAYGAVAAFGASYTALSGVLIVWAVRVAPRRPAESTIVVFIALAVGQAVGSTTFGLLRDVAPDAVTFTLAGVVGMCALLPLVRTGARPA